MLVYVILDGSYDALVCSSEGVARAHIRVAFGDKLPEPVAGEGGMVYEMGGVKYVVKAVEVL